VYPVRDGPELQNLHLDGDCCCSKFLQNSDFGPASLRCCLVTLILTLPPCNWSSIYQASHRNARVGCLLQIILRMKKIFVFSIFMPISTLVRQMNSKEMNDVHASNIWIVCVHTLWMNARKKIGEDWFNVVLVGLFITFVYEGFMVLSGDIAALIPWTSETEHVWQAMVETPWFLSERCLQLCWVDGMCVQLGWCSRFKLFLEVNGEAQSRKARRFAVGCVT